MIVKSCQYLLWSRIKPSLHYNLFFSHIPNLENKIKIETATLKQMYLVSLLSKINI